VLLDLVSLGLPRRRLIGEQSDVPTTPADTRLILHEIRDTP
jgi:hypothetical protein